MKKILTLLLLAGAISSSAQYEISSFTSTGRGGATSFVTDYQACGINPANLGWDAEFEEKRFTMGLTEMTFSIHSEALTKDELRQEFKTIIQNKSTADWTIDEKRQAGKDFANSGFAINGDLGSFGFAFNSEAFGGIAFRINDNFNTYTRLNETTSDMIFMGKFSSYFDSLVYVDPSSMDTTIIENYNMQDPDSIQNVANGFANVPNMIGEILNGSEMRLSWTREYNLSYGRKIFGKDDVIEIFGGIGLKYIQGFAMIDIQSVDNDLTAFSSVTPFFNIDYGSASAQNPSTTTQSGALPNSVGGGFGMDFGLDLLIKNKLKIAMAVTNIGSMTWKGNVYSMKDTLVIDTYSEGLNNYNVLQTIGDLSGDDGVFSWDGEKELTQKLNTNFRFGASFLIGEIAQVGVDVIAPMNDESPASLEKAIIGFGGDVKPIPWLRLSAGFMTGGNYDFSIPLGLTVITQKGTWEAGIASRDAITFFTQNGPTLSLSTGFMRFRF
ncbi:DUF5723 family protein [Parvicella tangerina]|uniref:DUF5723 domain-containing protein n=1 Tax=Parvicella tangerina TaxID=2829795 RepID=A0A916NH60_9FLAO|nr:DUF5723 family protein [Parvicella tangerina]CAG5080843.1 hypothetical protein CRYO30217_01459 [Parvicella tangerina]